MPKKHQIRAFTLVEILVALGIIVLLVSILIPFIARNFRESKKFRTLADFQAIAQAIEAYKQDFGDIPRMPTVGRSTGAATLGKALLGPSGDGILSGNTPDTNDPPVFDNTASYKAGDCVADTGGKYWVAIRPLAAGVTPILGSDWAEFDPHDGLDGPGFRIRNPGKTYGPYLDPAKVKHQGAFILDSDGNPVIYSPAKPGRSDVTKAPVNGPGPYVDLSQTGKPFPLFDAYDNIAFFYRTGEPTPATDVLAASRMQIMMGDYNKNGYVQSSVNETAVTKEYLLWAPGPDGVFGPAGFTPDTDINANRKAALACDDVTNFKE